MTIKTFKTEAGARRFAARVLARDEARLGCATDSRSFRPVPAPDGSFRYAVGLFVGEEFRAYVGPLAVAEIRPTSYQDISHVTDADGVTRRLSRAVRCF